MDASFFDLCPQPAAVLDAAGVLTRVNDAWERAFGETGVPGQKLVDCLLPEDRDDVQGALFRLAGSVTRFTTTVSGTKWIRWSCVFHFPTRTWYVVANDVTAEREAQEKLRFMNQHLPGVAFLYRTRPGERGKFEYISESARAMYAVDPDDAIMDPGVLFALIHRSDLRGFFRAMETSQADVQPGGHEFRVTTTRGLRYIRGTWNPTPQSDGSILWSGVYLDVHEQRMAEEALRETSVRFELAVRGTNDGIWDWNLQSGEIWFSPRWKQILGYEDHELPNDSTTWRGSILPEDRADAWNRAIAFNEGKLDEYLATHRYRHKDGSVRYLLSRATNTRDEHGRATRMVGAVTDITEMMRAREEAEAASKAKSAFLANMSHEIRTPMNGVLGMAQVLGNTPLDQEQRHFVDTIRASAESLLTILNDILDLSKVEAGKLAITPLPTQIEPIFRDMDRLYRPMADAKGLRLNIELPSTPMPFLLVDAPRIRQVSTNLLGNALKFTQEGEVTLRIAFHEGRLRVSVTDTGIGIPPERQAQIFESFTQADASTSRVYGGTGLGLTISRSLVQLMNGRLGVESEVGHGSTFWFEIPAEECSPEIVMDLPSAPQENDETPLVGRVLLAEDNEVNVLVAQTLLEDMGLVVDIAWDGHEAVEMASAKTYDIVLMDLHMPRMDGADATRRLRNAGNRVPIVAMTAAAREEDRRTCFEAGMNGYVTKPFESGEVRKLLAGYLTRAEA